MFDTFKTMGDPVTNTRVSSLESDQNKALIDTAIKLLFLGVLLYSALVMLVPLADMVIWAGILAIAVYPVFDWLQQKLGGRKSLAATILVVLGLLLTLGPIATAVSATVGVVAEFVDKMESGQLSIPPTPEKLGDVPIIGGQLMQIWSLFERNLSAAFETYETQIKDVSKLVLETVAGFAINLLGLALSTVVMGALLAPGPAIVKKLQAFANRMFAPNGAQYITMAGATIVNVTKGVVGVAALQAFGIWICLFLFGIPSAAVFALICFFLSVVQVGPSLVMIPLVIYAWSTMSGGTALLFTVVCIPLMIGDNFLRPVLISKGLSTPTVVIFVGVIGGVLAYGLIGIFIGPVLFAVFYELYKMWMDAGSDSAADGSAEKPE